MAFGPVDFVAVQFPGTELSREIVAELKRVVENGTIRIIDLLFISKAANGDVTAIEVSQLEDDDYSAWNSIVDAVSGYLTAEDGLVIADSLEPASSAALVLLENTWAVDLVNGIKNARGEVLISERIPRVVVEELVALHVD